MARSSAPVRKVGVYPIDRVQTRSRSGEVANGYQVRWVSLPVSEANQRTIQSVVTSFGQGRSAATETRRWAALRGLLRWAHQTDRVDRDLTIGVRPRTRDRDEVDPDKIPSVEEMWAMSEACAELGEEWRALAPLLGGAGPRIGEVIAMRRRHVREHEASGGMWIDIRRSVTRTGTDWGDGQATIFRGTKGRGEGNKVGRTTYLPKAEAAVLRRHLVEHVAPEADAFLFAAGGNRPMDLGHLSDRVWTPAREAVFPAPHRLENLGRHNLRHLACTRWLNCNTCCHPTRSTSTPPSSGLKPRLSGTSHAPEDIESDGPLVPRNRPVRPFPKVWPHGWTIRLQASLSLPLSTQMWCSTAGCSRAAQISAARIVSKSSGCGSGSPSN
ncbi:tyrosine-type recombinase/integrase [Aquihabitans daechungensis]|uniref:tyrosine-type recombinase/integrase n=1 Tax=Aquihabitans daechungensis TaxID=1052257 RepID=UPI003BA36BD0